MLKSNNLLKIKFVKKIFQDSTNKRALRTIKKHITIAKTSEITQYTAVIMICINKSDICVTFNTYIKSRIIYENNTHSIKRKTRNRKYTVPT